MLTLLIPEHMRGQSIAALKLSRLAGNRLLLAGIRTLGQLHGKNIADIGALPGVGARCLEEIITAVQGLDYRLPEHLEVLASPSDTAADNETSILCVPGAAVQWPISALDIPASVRAALTQEGITELGMLDGMSESDLTRLHYVGAPGRRAIVNAIAELTTLPDPSVVRKSASGALSPPSAPLSLFTRVEHATSPAEEVEAILEGLSDRTSQILRLRWAQRGGQSRTLEEIARRFGISRERVRQIVGKQEALLRTSNLWLPKLARVIELLDTSGGALPTQRLLRQASSLGYPLDAEVLTYAEALGQIGLIPAVTYDEEARLWLTPKGSAAWVPGGRLAEPLQVIRRTVRRAVNRSGCIAVRDLDRAPFGARHAISIGLNRGTRLDRIGEYLVPGRTADSTLGRWTAEMLAVTPELSLDDIGSGLRRGTVVYRGHRERIDIPPSAVLREVLSRDGRFVLSEDMVQVSTPAARQDVLSSTEEVIVAAIERLNNVATWAQILEAGKAAGCATATVTLVLRKPFIVKRGAGIYALRGREVSHETLRARTRERAATRREAVKRVSYSGGTRARVVYELTGFSINGVLPVPNKMRGLANRSWRARLPGGRELKVKMRSGFIWPLYRWFASDQLKRGDLIVADFDIPNGVIEFDVAS